MKALNILSVILLFVLFSCNSGVKTNGYKVTFGIYETVKSGEAPESIIDTLKSMNVQSENNQEGVVIGYVTKVDTSIFQLRLPEENIQLVKTYYPVDKDKKYYAVVAVRPIPVINNSHINKTKAKRNTVEIYFNMEGANKWAELTKQNVGNKVAIVINSQVYSMPLISAEIRNGIALISGIEDEISAKNISESLNSSISD